MKKFLALFLALVMVLALAACSSTTEPAEEEVEEVVEVEETVEETEEVEEAEEVEEVEEVVEEEPVEEASDANEIVAVQNEDGTVHVNDDVDLTGYTLGYVTINSAAPWGGLVGTSFEAYATEAGAEVKVLDAQTDPDKVVEYCEQMISAGVDALAVFGGDPTAMVDIAEQCADAGIGLFMLALDVAEEGRDNVVACVGPDQEQMCYDIGQYVIEQNGADAGCLVVQINGVPFLEDYIERNAGFAAAMEETNYDVKEKVDAYSSRSDAKAFMEDFLTTYGDDIDIVMGYDDDLTMGAVAAIDEAGKTGTIKVYSLTGQNDAIQAVADGQMELTVVNRAQDIGAEAVNAVFEYLTTGTTVYYHRTPLTYVTAENVDQWIGNGEF